MFRPQTDESVLFITLDSCRYDTFSFANAPNLRRVGKLHPAMAPGSFTFASHSAMFVGFTPGVAAKTEAYVNPKYAKIFRLVSAGTHAFAKEPFNLTGRNIIDGFNNLQYTTIGSGAAGWFNTGTLPGKQLTQDFQHFWYPGDTWSLGKQLTWLSQRLAEAEGNVFCFLNVGETHVPYYYEGAAWENTNPFRPFDPASDADECRRRQRACLEWTDAKLAPLLAAFEDSTIVVCGDHGDCWGEDGLWGHGFSHPKVLEVPLLMRLPAHLLA